ncbi:hypothetical protein MIMGU_mgv11b008018mg [Erythranthe guttata]|uniref:Uncharacterized protein n=1 Tax=Erythranthe guttata TaxID=4155 RepID=A0A022RDK4_ERYGU|nr:hypothetical protein MIMGU_mgv11b008018mg [Erythranthe guttata]
MLRRAIKIVRRPKMVDITRLPRVEPQPRLPFPTPMKKTNRTGVQSPAFPFDIITTQTMLIPPMVNRLDIPGKNKQEGGQRPQLINPLMLLHNHPILDFLRISPVTPPVQVHDHHPRVELRDVVDDDEVGIEVDEAVDLLGEDVGEVYPGVVEGLVEGLADRFRDESADAGGVELVEFEVEVRECGFNARKHVRLVADPQEMEDDVLRAGGVLEDREDRRNRAAEVVGVKGHGNVDGGIAVGAVIRAGFAIAEGGGFAEGERGGVGGEGVAGGGGGGVGFGGGGGGEEERQEAEEKYGRGEGDHPALIIIVIVIIIMNREKKGEAIRGEAGEEKV